MMSRRWLSAIGILLAAASASATTIESSECTKSIDAVRDGLVEAAQNHDGAAGAALFTPEGSFSGPGFHAGTAEELERLFAGTLDEAVRIDTLQLVVDLCGKASGEAIEWGTMPWRMPPTDSEPSAAKEQAGEATEVWTDYAMTYIQGDDRRWRIDTLLVWDPDVLEHPIAPEDLDQPEETDAPADG